MKYYKIRPEGLNWIIDRIENIPEYLKESESGDKWEIEVVEMTEEEYEELPESMGF